MLPFYIIHRIRVNLSITSGLRNDYALRLSKMAYITVNQVQWHNDYIKQNDFMMNHDLIQRKLYKYVITCCFQEKWVLFGII